MDDASGLSADVQIHLLGPLELLIGGRLVPAGGPRQRALLALLALSVGVAVPASHLVELLWEDAPPPAAANTVQVYVSRLRRLFTADGGVSPLHSVSGAYLLDLPSEAIDAGRFEALSDRGRARLATGHPAAAEDLRAALAVWRGAALPDLAGTAVARAAVARLESMRLAVLADRIDADALLGRHVTLIPELAGLVLEYPLDERFVGQLMTAHYRAGRQAEAFAVYTSAADRLADELGVDPGPALRALHTRILRQDAELDPGIDGRIQAEPASAGWKLPAGPRLDQTTSASLIGRRAELSIAMALIGHPEARLITVFGPGGAGKTRLVAEVATLLAAETNAIRVIFVPLAAVFDAAQVPAEICRVLDAEPDWPGEPAMEVAIRALSAGPAVVVLDNLEQLAADDLSGVAEMLARVGKLTVLATSRTVLGLPGERLLRLGPLPLPAVGADCDLASVLGAEAVQLFRERARAALPEFEVTVANAGVVAALCRGLDGLPLALELAAARVRVLPPEEILHRLDRRLELLTGGAAHLPARQRSMWAALDWSARLLDPSELLIFGQLSVFVGGWTLAAAEQVCGPLPVEPSTVDVLARLAEKSLVVADGTGRLGMLETVRDYAQEVLAADPAVAALTRDRHAGYYAGLAEELGPQSRGWLGASGGLRAGLSPREQLDCEAGNLRLALEHAAGDRVPGDRVDGELLGRLVVALLDHWFASGRLREADRWLQVARRSELSAALRARLLLSFGNLAVVGGDLPAAAEALAEAHETALRFGDSLLTVRTFAARAVAARYLGRPDAALALLTDALETLAREGVPEATGLECALENELGEVLDELDRGPEAVELWQECRRRAAAMDNPVQLAYPLVNLARAALDRGAGDEARALVEQALTAAEASGSAPVRADVLAAAGCIDHRTGRGRQAVAQLREAIRLGHDCGQLLPLPEVVALLGSVLVSDQPRVAARLLAAAEAWRAAHSIRAVPRLSRAIVAEAEAALAIAVGAGELSVDQLEAERRRGAGTPFGSLRGLCLLDPGLRGTPELIDLTEPDVIDLRSLDRVGRLG
ncbi:MAG TPA: BTAD domain-containing putative transcriptional regulator [Kineosporiaceae bacterium]|nr:BTAD domain-containing putative transcriptional regulator [Kineosporiaceae bacterium]